MVSNHVPFPELNAWVVGYLEWIGGVLLLVGLLTRPAALALLGTMLVAVSTADRDDFRGSWGPTGDKGPTDIASWALLCYLAWLVMLGAGPLSLDWLFGRLVRRWAGLDRAENDQVSATN